MGIAITCESNDYLNNIVSISGNGNGIIIVVRPDVIVF